jgi:hypothetical protein
MNAPRYARLAGKLFVQGRRSIPPAAPASEARARAIAVVARAITARRRRRRVAGWATAFASVAAVAAAALGVGRVWVQGHRSPPASATGVVDAQIVAHPVGAGARIVLSGAQASLAEGAALRSGGRVITPANGGVSLLFSTGTSAVLGAWGDLTVIGDGAAQVVRLDSGSVDLHVAKLGVGQRFLVDTPDAEVEVRGTRFRVSVVPADPSCGRGTWTRVVVTEGVVEVRHAGAEARVAAGEQWPTDCGRTASVDGRPARTGSGGTSAASAAAWSKPAVGPAVGPAVAPSAPAARAAGPSAESTLGAQNNLFAQAVAAKRGGDVPGAIAILDRFLARYPASPLTESVMVERIRLLRSADPALAASAAAQYLGRYPNGFARAEAESMVVEAP